MFVYLFRIPKQGKKETNEILILLHNFTPSLSFLLQHMTNGREKGKGETQERNDNTEGSEREKKAFRIIMWRRA